MNAEWDRALARRVGKAARVAAERGAPITLNPYVRGRTALERALSYVWVHAYLKAAPERPGEIDYT